MAKKQINRRRFLQIAGLTTVGAALAACQPQVVEKIVKETVVVQGTPEVVEKVVKETVVVKEEVEKEVTKVVEKVVESGIRNIPRERTVVIYFGGSGGRPVYRRRTGSASSEQCRHHPSGPQIASVAAEFG